MASLKSLTDDDLRKKLKQYGITSPVTASTRDILIKKLNHVIANQKKSSTPNSTVNKTPGKSSNRLHTFSSDEDEDESSIHYPSSRTSRLSRSKRDSVKCAVETPVSDRNGSTNLNGSSNISNNSSGGVRRVKFSSSGEGRGRVGSLRSSDDSNVGKSHSANSSSVLSVNDISYSEEPATKRTRVSLGTYYPVCARSGIGPRAKVHDDYETGSDSDLAECEDAVDLSSKAAAASGMCNSRENSVLSNNNSFNARAFYQNHKSGISSPSNRLGLLKGDNVRSRKGRQTSFLENGRRHEDEYSSENHEKSFSEAESVVTQTASGNHEPMRVANGRHHSESNSPIDPSPGDESTWHYSIPLLLLVLLAVFFGVVAMLYVNMRIPLLPMVQSVPAMFCQAMANLPVPFLARTDPERQNQAGAPTLPSPQLQPSQPPTTENPPSSSSQTSENIFPICNNEITTACLTRQEIAAFHQIAMKLENVVLPAVHQQEGLFQCGQSAVRYMSVADMQTLLEDAQIVSENGSSDSIVALGKLVDLNRHWGLEAVRGGGDGEALLGISLISPPTHILCHVKAAIHSMLELIIFLILAIGTCWLTYTCVKYHRHKKELEKQQVFEMVEQILEILGGLVGPSGKDFVAVNHVRDSIIGPRDRKTKKDIWKEAVLFIDNYESRIRREIQSVGGEDCEIWRWTSGVPHSPGNSPGLDGTGGRPPAKMWQGQAFESLETTHNLPNVSPTSCLKIRNMFDCDVEFGDSWPSRIQDSILEKCEGISIVHVAVDRASREGCVYLKCASLGEAGRAFRALHGWWYDGNLVTVKFLRDERYHQRFPSACHATRRLRPSNNKRLSLQVPAGQSDSVEHP